MIIIREKYKNFFPTEIFVISFNRRDGIRNPAKTFILLEKRKCTEKKKKTNSPGDGSGPEKKSCVFTDDKKC